MNTIATLNGYKIKKGLTDSQINQLIDYSQTDTDVKKYTGDFDRFKDRISFDQFSSQVIEYYALVDNQDNLFGIIWFDNFAYPLSGYEDYKISYAIRLYAGARGKGLSGPFTKACLEDFDQKNIWLSVYANNQKAISAYESVGFKKVDFWEEKNKDLMVLKKV